MPRSSRRSRTPIAIAIVIAAASLAAAACEPPPAPATRAAWLAAAPMPSFDPYGPPEPLRHALERLLARGLTDVDSSGAVVGALAESWTWSADRCTLRFRLRSGLTDANDSLITASDVRDAVLAGLARTDHRRAAHLLAAVAGVAAPRGRKSVAPGIRASDASTLEFTLTRPDSLLPLKLALPGLSAPWRTDTAAWLGAAGCGPYRVVAERHGRSLTLARRDSPLPAVATVDTLTIQFVRGAQPVRDRLRRREPDLVWPLPPDLLDADPPEGYVAGLAAARPERRLVLVLRADRPPLTQLDRRARLLADSESRGSLARLGRAAQPIEPPVSGAQRGLGPRRPPPRPVAASPGLERGITRIRDRDAPGSFHVRLGYDADSPAARLAPLLEERWAERGLYAEREPLVGARVHERSMARDGPQAMLVLVQPPLEGPAEAIAPLVESARGVPMAGFRTGWRPRELEVALESGTGFDPEAARLRLEQDRVAAPLARLDWAWFERTGPPTARLHPRFGLEYTELRRPATAATGH